MSRCRADDARTGLVRGLFFAGGGREGVNEAVQGVEPSEMAEFKVASRVSGKISADLTTLGTRPVGLATGRTADGRTGANGERRKDLSQAEEDKERESKAWTRMRWERGGGGREAEREMTRIQ